jgi:hypothetical protein
VAEFSGGFVETVRKDITILRCSDLEGDNNAATDIGTSSLSSTLMTLGQLHSWKNQIPPLKKDPHTHLLSLSLSLYGVKLEERRELAAD